VRILLALWTLLTCLAGLAGCGGSDMGGTAYPSAMHGGMAEPAADMPDVDRDAVMDVSDEGEQYQLEDDKLSADFRTRAKEAPPPPPPASKAPQAGGAPGQPAQSEAVAARAPMLIYTAQVTMAVFEVNESLNKVEAIARDLGGFLARRDDRAITIRVPVARFDEALSRIEDAGDMLHRNVAVEDVTEEYLDLEIRLRNARAVRDRLEKLLEKAATVEESVLLEKELGRVAGEIERLEGRMKYLRDRAAFSTITVTFQPRPRESIDPSGARLPVSWLGELGLARLLNL
jgi:hypothetical protein